MTREERLAYLRGYKAGMKKTIRRSTERVEGVTLGGPCTEPGCSGIWHVYSTHPNPQLEIRTLYLKCDRCGFQPPGNAIEMPLKYRPMQRRRK